jgi:hypothetical protein
MEQDHSKGELGAAAHNRCLSVSPDKQIDNHRKVSYMSATAYYLDGKGRSQSIYLFLAEAYTYEEEWWEHR